MSGFAKWERGREGVKHRVGSKLLINEPPLELIPTLAEFIGVNEALFVQQLHYWIISEQYGTVKDGRVWIRHSIASLQKKKFRFWSAPTIKRLLTGLLKRGIILKRTDLNLNGADRTPWYSLDYDRLEEVCIEEAERIRAHGEEDEEEREEEFHETKSSRHGIKMIPPRDEIVPPRDEIVPPRDQNDPATGSKRSQDEIKMIPCILNGSSKKLSKKQSKREEPSSFEKSDSVYGQNEAERFERTAFGTGRDALERMIELMGEGFHEATGKPRQVFTKRRGDCLQAALDDNPQFLERFWAALLVTKRSTRLRDGDEQIGSAFVRGIGFDYMIGYREGGSSYGVERILSGTLAEPPRDWEVEAGRKLAAITWQYAKGEIERQEAVAEVKKIVGGTQVFRRGLTESELPPEVEARL